MVTFLVEQRYIHGALDSTCKCGPDGLGGDLEISSRIDFFTIQFQFWPLVPFYCY